MWALGRIAVVLHVTGAVWHYAAEGAKPSSPRDHGGIVRREDSAEEAGATLVQQREASTARRGIGDAHVISNYGRHVTSTRQVSEKSTCQGACTGWSTTDITQLGSGTSTMQVHGMFSGTAGSNTELYKDFSSLNSASSHTLARVSFIFWSMGEWSSGEKGYLDIDGTEVWAKERSDSYSCTGWTDCGLRFSDAPQNVSCCQLVSRSFNHDANDMKITIGSNIGNSSYAFAFSDLVLDLIDD